MAQGRPGWWSGWCWRRVVGHRRCFEPDDAFADSASRKELLVLLAHCPVPVVVETRVRPRGMGHALVCLPERPRNLPLEPEPVVRRNNLQD
jgi:hypothetical protein